jgi:precorrin-2/cobalt-factor-2 C20-methyltransferase
LEARLQQADSAAIIKVGRHFTRVRALLDRLGLADSAHYVERATMESQRVLPLRAVDEQAVPYFSMILTHRRGRAWS